MSKSAKLSHCMIDLETMGVKPGCAIVSIGAVLFDPRYGISKGNTFYRELDWEYQGRSIEQSCMDNFWSKQPKEVRDALYGLDDLEEVLKELSAWLPADIKVWGNGPTFDIIKLEDAYDQHGIEIPWKFWNIRDCRTIKDMYESQRGGFDKKVGGNAHNALDDAIHQAEYVTFMWNKLLGDNNV